MRTDRARFIRLLLQPALVAWAHLEHPCPLTAASATACSEPPDPSAWWCSSAPESPSPSIRCRPRPPRATSACSPSRSARPRWRTRADSEARRPPSRRRRGWPTSCERPSPRSAGRRAPAGAVSAGIVAYRDAVDVALRAAVDLGDTVDRLALVAVAAPEQPLDRDDLGALIGGLTAKTLRRERSGATRRPPPRRTWYQEHLASARIEMVPDERVACRRVGSRPLARGTRDGAVRRASAAAAGQADWSDDGIRHPPDPRLLARSPAGCSPPP